MNKLSTAKSKRGATSEMRSEYRLDYRKARPNRFAPRTRERVVVVLDPDVARIFTTSETVNNLLRALIANMPTPSKAKDALK